MTKQSLRGEVLRPSDLGPSEIALWHQMLAQSPSLQRAFFTPAFALACERALGHAYVAVLHSGATIRGFLPFQFKTAWHQRIGLAERIGGNMSDAAGLIAWPDLRIDTATLMQAAGLASLHLSHIMPGQEQPELDIDWSQTSFVTDLSAGPAAYFADLETRNRTFVRDTERCDRKANKTYGPPALLSTDRIPADRLAGAIAAKRRQYQETKVADPFGFANNLHLLEALNETPAPECRLVLASLDVGGRSLAQHLGLLHNGVMSWWFPAYDPEAKAVSPGRLLLWYVIRNATEDGIRLIDYGEGEAEYKRQFSTGTLRLGRAMWSAHNARSLLAHAWQSVEWRLHSRSLRLRKPAVGQN